MTVGSGWHVSVPLWIGHHTLRDLDTAQDVRVVWCVWCTGRVYCYFGEYGRTKSRRLDAMLRSVRSPPSLPPSGRLVCCVRRHLHALLWTEHLRNCQPASPLLSSQGRIGAFYLRSSLQRLMCLRRLQMKLQSSQLDGVLC